MDTHEIEKENLILDLARSRSFADTHSVIRRLSDFTDFTDSEAHSLVFAAACNVQVCGIMQDFDVLEFYANLLRGREDTVGVGQLPILERLLEEKRRDEPASLLSDEDDGDDLPY